MDEETKQDSKRKIKTKGKEKIDIIVTVLEGEKIDFGKTFILKKKKIFIGRGKNNDITLNDLKVSKNHCTIEVELADELGVDTITLTDLFSTNGTYLNGRIIERAILKFGDKIDVGSTILLFKSSDEVEKKYQSTLFDIATLDSLTGLFTRRYILNELENHKKIAVRYNRLFSLILFDIDDFKKINDRFGHPAGDEYLKRVTSEICDCLREQDKAGRVGGEEFLVILPETNIKGAKILANRIRRNIEKSILSYKDALIKATISAGVVQFDSRSDESTNMFEIADAALYEAKSKGKDKVILASIYKK